MEQRREPSFHAENSMDSVASSLIQQQKKTWFAKEVDKNPCSHNAFAYSCFMKWMQPFWRLPSHSRQFKGDLISGHPHHNSALCKGWQTSAWSAWRRPLFSRSLMAAGKFWQMLHLQFIRDLSFDAICSQQFSTPLFWARISQTSIGKNSIADRVWPWEDSHHKSHAQDLGEVSRTEQTDHCYPNCMQNGLSTQH